MMTTLAAACMATANAETLELKGASFKLNSAAAIPDIPWGDYGSDLFTDFNKGWEGTVSAGLTGSDGNTQRYNFRGEVEGERKTELHRLKGSFVYSWAQDDGDESENRARINFRDELIIPDSKWFGFGEFIFDYDEFQAWDARVSGFNGLGYAFMDSEDELLKVRGGGGITREFGSSDNTFQSEALIGAEYQKQITERQRLEAELTIFPALDEFGEGRIVARAVWELVVDPEVNMNFRAGIEDRYDSQPDGAKRNDVDFFLMLSWGFGGEE